MLRIAFLLPSLRNLGPIIVAKDIIDYLVLNKLATVEVYYFDEFNDETLQFPVNTKRINFLNKYDFSKYDIVHSHGIRPDYYTFFNKTCKKTISTQHNIIYDEYIINSSKIKTKIIEKIWMFSLRNKNCVVSIGETAKNYYSKFLKNNVINIPNGRSKLNINEFINSEDLEKINFLKDKYICIGTCTRVIKRKGHLQILKALVDLPNFCFILVGDGDYLNFLKKTAIELNINDRCLFLGYRKNAISYLPFFDIYSQTSYAESISIALLEAASFNKLIVCSDIPVNRDVFNSDEVFFFENDNISHLVNVLKKSILYRNDYENRVFLKYSSEYTLDIMVNRYLNLYESLINEI